MLLKKPLYQMRLCKEIEVFKDKSLSEFCTFKIGGKAKYVVVVHSLQQLYKVCLYCASHNIRFKVIGLGANLLFDDNGYNGVVIINRSDKILFRKNCVYIDSGVNLTSIINECANRNLGGIENLAGIPSSIGGAVVNGLGAFGVNFYDYVDYINCLDLDSFKTFKVKKEDCCFGYRTSIFKTKNFIILGVKIKLNFLDKSTIKTNMQTCLKRKAETQPLNYPSAGSVFKRFALEEDKKEQTTTYFESQENTKNNEVIPAKIIDDLGLKGLSVGGAVVSPKHAGFIVNTGSATSKDVKDLIKIIQEKVQKEYGFTLPLEIEIVE